MLYYSECSADCFVIRRIDLMSKSDAFPDPTSRPLRDIVVIGGSAGAAEALSEIVAGLPGDFAASVFVVVHVAPSHTSWLPSILSRKTNLPVSFAEHGGAISPAHIYIAPADHHLTLQDGKVSVLRGPKENGHRPAVDPLFRTAARVYGPRVIGVVLSGGLDCGSAGLLTIKARGGTAIVQHPNDAVCPDMPTNALRNVPVEHVVAAAEIGQLLAKLVSEPLPEKGAAPMPQAKEHSSEQLVPIVCPECQGALTETRRHGLFEYQCHVGHRYSLEAMLAEQSNSLESALWASVRALEESATLATRLAGQSSSEMNSRFEEKARTMRHYAETIKGILLSDGATLQQNLK